VSFLSIGLQTPVLLCPKSNRKMGRQKQEFMIGCGVLNKMTSLGMPVSSKIV
jgi:hypothetical protein